MTRIMPEQSGKAVNLFVFGDLSAIFEDDLRNLLHMKHHEMLQSFFDRVAYKLRSDLSKQPAHIQDLFPRFTSLIDIVARLGETEGTPVLRFFLLTVCQVAKFILVTSTGKFPTADNAQLLGICTGAFAAAAVSVSTNTLEVVSSGVEAARIAFQTALCSFIQRNTISTAPNDSWSSVVSTKLPVQATLAEFQARSSPRKLSQPYISATSPTSVTVSGPPDILHQFLTKNNLDHHPLAIQSPFHASHLFHNRDIDRILETLPSDEVSLAQPQIPLLSCSTGELFIASSFRELLRAVVSDVLRGKVQWDSILDGLGRLVQSQWESCTIYPFHSQAVSAVSSYLSKVACIGVSVHNLAFSTQQQSVDEATGRFEHSKIAIVGFSGRFPEAATPDEYWQLLHEGRDVHRTIPEDRFDWKAHFDATGKTKNTSRVQYGCFIKEPGLFDTKFFNMSPREADNTDPAQRLAITATYEAIEMAGMVPNRTPSTQQDRIGVFFGVTSDDWREVNSGQNVDTYFIPGGNRAFVPGRISYFFRFSGPSLSIDTACSSSFAAIQTACSHLWRGECDTAIAGGTNVLTNPDNFAGLDRGHFLSTKGNCNAFDDEASGYCRADAVGAAIFKRLEDAIADGDPIFGVIAGTNTNHCGQTDSITRPHEGDQVSVFKRVMRTRNIDPNSISYIEMHGTGTQAGDATEMRSVLSVFLPDHKRNASQPLFLGSAKANIGHSESASGVSSLIKVLMMMKHNEIPPHCGIKGVINRNYPKDLAERNVNIALKPTPWRREDSADRTRRVFLNNFSAAGGNTAILLEDAPEYVQKSHGTENAGMSIVAVSAKSSTALKANISKLIQFIDANPDASLSSLAYTTTARRMHHNYRTICSGSSIAAIAKELGSRLSDDIKAIPPPTRTPNIVFTFSGQGSLYSGLGRQFFQDIPDFRDDLLRFDQIAQEQGFPSFLPLVEDSSSSLDAADVCSTHLILLCFEMALYRLMVTWNIIPAAVIGHSLGEYATFYAAGIISASDAIFLVGTRAQLLLKHCKAGTHAMLAIKASVDVVTPWLEGSNCELACINQPQGTVVSGEIGDIKDMSNAVKSQGYEAVLLDIPFAFHSAQIEPILEEFRDAAQTVSYRPANLPVLSPLLKQICPKGSTLDAEYLTRACRGVVDFNGALQEAKSSGLVNDTTIWLEIGPHTTNSGLTKSIFSPQAKALNTMHKSKPMQTTIAAVLESLYKEGLNIDWNSFHRPRAENQEVVQLPRYSWDLKNHWIMYRNNFCLLKGEGTVATPAETTTAHKAPRYLSPSLQRILEETHGEVQSTMLVESDVFHDKLLPVFRGHLVNGVALCPSSLYGDIAIGIAEEMLSRAGKKFSSMDVCEVHANRPFIALTTETSHLFRVSATADWEGNCISLSIYSTNANGSAVAEHATLKVRLSNSNPLNEWKPKAYLINGRISALKQGLLDGEVHRLKKSMVYKLFESIVSYKPAYCGIQEVMLDSEQLEASAKVTFQVGDDGFHVNPHWIDSLGQIAGFIMNGNEYLQSEKQVFINHGWGHMRFGEKVEAGKVYTTYNRMQLVEGTLHSGDTYILDGDRIVAIFEGVQFQGVPRKVLDNLLPAKQRSQAQPPRTTASLPPPKAPTQNKPVSVAVSHKAPKKATPDNFERILAIVAEETGVQTVDMGLDCEFTDLGIDSLLSLTVCSRISEEVGLDLSSSLFVDCPTVRDLQSKVGAAPIVVEEELDVEDSSTDCTDSVSGEDTPSYSSVGGEIDIGAILRSTIADETGAQESELTLASSLADLGVDSLLGLTIASSLSEVLNADVSSSALLEHSTLGEVEAALMKLMGFEKLAPTAKKAAQAIQAPPVPGRVGEADSSPHATSVILQGSRAASSQPIFLLPDGSGSAASYASLAKLGPNTTVYGLNCPWRTTPEDMTRSGIDMSQLAAKYVTEILKRQPQGPYVLGGWSAGGICAFEASRQLQAAGHKVSKLLLLDSPNPIGLQNPPARMYDFFESLGVFGGPPGSKTAIPPWLRKHFDAFINILDNYEPVPLADAPPTAIIYARDGICKDSSVPRPAESPDDPREMRWLINNRTDFSADGWASLVGRGNIKVYVLDGVNHFTMMDAGEQMEMMGSYLRAEVE